MDLHGQVGLVTGGASGLGAAIAARLVDLGASVVITDVDVADGAALAQKLGAEFVAQDVSDPDRWVEVVSQIEGSHGRLDAVFLNAGRGTGEESFGTGVPPVDEVSLETYQSMKAVNIDGVFYGVRTVVPLEQTGGSIVVTASMAGLVPVPTDPLYTLTKHALVGFVRAVAPSLEERGIRVHALCPGAIDTPLVVATRAQLERDGHLSSPEHIATQAVSLIAVDSSGGAWIAAVPPEPRRHKFSQL